MNDMVESIKLVANHSYGKLRKISGVQMHPPKLYNSHYGCFPCMRYFSLIGSKDGKYDSDIIYNENTPLPENTVEYMDKDLMDKIVSRRLKDNEAWEARWIKNQKETVRPMAQHYSDQLRNCYEAVGMGRD